MNHATTIATLIILPAALLPISLPARSQTGNEPAECTAALQSTQSRLRKGNKVGIRNLAAIDVSAMYEGYPDNRPSGYSLRLNGSGAESVMKSPKLLSSISKDIIDACPSASLIQFNLSGTDWVLTFGLVGEGNIELFKKCVDPRSRPEKTPWGSIDCL